MAATQVADRQLKTAPGGSAWTTVKKTAQTQVRNNSTVLQNDDALTMVIPANATVSFVMLINYTTLAAADFKWRLVGSNTPTLVNVLALSSIAGGAITGVGYIAFNAADVSVTSTGTQGILRLEGTIQNTSSSCTVNFQWAQNTATVGDTRVLVGSYLEHITI